jgi:lysophospholipase
VAPDGVRVRVALTPVEGARGTILIFPGRTEVVEKYGKVAGRFAAAGWASAAIDWRGQGLADRLLEDPDIGHVARFGDYQRDVAAYLDTVQGILPEPFVLLGHSMGGAIGLRAVLDGIDVRAAGFSAPMWGIFMPPLQAPFNLALAKAMDLLGRGRTRAPTTPRHSYLLESRFAGNTLTTDEGEWAYMRAQVEAEARFGLGGPSIHWLRESLKECAALVHAPPRALPLLAAMGSREQIVSKPAIRTRVGTWPGAELVEIEGARHELMMERPDLREQFETRLLDFFAAACA